MMTHDYKRHGTTTLFAALDVKSGKVIPLGTSRAAMPCRAMGDCMPRHPLPLSWFACKPREGRQGVPEISAADRQGRARASSRASGARQLRHPQDARGESMVGHQPFTRQKTHTHRDQWLVWYRFLGRHARRFVYRGSLPGVGEALKREIVGLGLVERTCLWGFDGGESLVSDLTYRSKGLR